MLPALRYQFCPLCRAQLVRRVVFDDGIPRVICKHCEWIQRSTNAAGVVTVARCDESIAVIRPPGEDGVSLPAGLVEYGESPEEAAVREVREETGFECRVVRSLGWFFESRDTWPGPIVQFLYDAEITGGTMRGSQEGPAELLPLDAFPGIVSSARLGSQRAIRLFLDGS